MPPERLTGIGSGSKDKWPTHDARDDEFEATREIAIGLVDEDDLKFIGTQQDLLDSYVKYNFKNPKSKLSSLVKNVIWGLWENEKTRDNLFPEEIDTEEKLREFIDDKEKHSTPVGRSIVNFAILAVRSGFVAIPMRRRVEEHIESQLSFFLEDIFDEWIELLKNKNAKFNPSKYKNDEERSKAEETFRKKMQLRFRLISWVSNSEKLHNELMERYYIEGNMNVFGFFLRKLLNIDTAGAKVKELMIGVIDKQFNDKRKQLLDLIDGLKADSKKKAAKEREAIKAIEIVADGVGVKTAAAHITPKPGTIKTISGVDIPVPGRIEEPSASDTDPEDLDSGFDEDETSGVYYAETGEKTEVFKKGRKVKFKGKRPISPTAHSEKPNEVTIVRTDIQASIEPADQDTDVDAILPATEGTDIDVVADQTQTDEEILHASHEVEPEELSEEDLDEVEDAEDAEASDPEPAALSEFDLTQNYNSGPAPAAPERGLKPVLKVNTPKVVKQYTSQEPVPAHELDLSHSEPASPASTDGTTDASSTQERETFNVYPPVPGLAIKTPLPAQPALSATLKKQITKLAEKASDQRPEPAAEPAPEAAVKAVINHGITLPELPSFRDKLTDEKNPKKPTERLKSWVGSNPKTVKAVILGVVLAVLGGSGYLTYKHEGKKDSLRGKDKVASKSTIDVKKEKVIMAPISTMESTMEPSMGPTMAPSMKAPMHTVMQAEAMRQAATMQHAMRPESMQAPMHAVMSVAGMKAPKEVMAASKDIMKPQPAHRTAPIQKTVDVRGATSNPRFANIDVKTVDDLPDGIYKQMWQGKKFNLEGNVSYSKFLEDALKNMIKKLPRKERYKALYAYYQELRKTENGWLLYKKLLEESLVEKALTKEGLTEKEEAQLKDWNDYQKRHRGRAKQAKELLQNYKWLMKSKKKGKAYKMYEDYRARGVELMEFPGVAHLERSADNILPHEKISYATKDGKALGTMVRMTKAIKKVAKSFPMPDLAMGSTTGSIEQTPSHTMFAEHQVDAPTPPPIPADAVVHQVDDSQILSVAPLPPNTPKSFGSAPMPDLKPVLGDMLAKRPPRIPADARVYKIEPKDMFDVKMAKPQDFGSAPMPELKAVLAAMDRKRKQTPPPIPQDAYYKLTEDDILPEPPPIPVEESQILKVKNMAPEPKMYGAAPLPKEIKPILGVKPPAIPADARPQVYDIPRGESNDVPEYASITDDRMPKVGPPPIPAMADVAKTPKKKSLWGRAKNWFKEKLA